MKYSQNMNSYLLMFLFLAVFYQAIRPIKRIITRLFKKVRP